MSHRSSTGPRALPAAAALLLAAVVLQGCDRGTTVDGVLVSGRLAEAGTAAMDSTSIRARTAFLATDHMRGRAPGTEGGMLAARYVASEFRSMALAAPDGGGDVLESYFQTVPILGVTPEPTLSFVSADGRSRYSPEYLTDYVTWSYAQSPRVTFGSEVVFVGYGIVAPEYDWNDYAGADVEGKIVVALVNDPGGTGGHDGFRGDTLTYYGRWTYKYEEAERRGAAGMLLIHTDESAGYGWSVVRNSWSGEQFEIPLPEDRTPLRMAGWLTRDAASRALDVAGTELEELVAAARDPGFTARPLPLRATGDVRSEIRRMDSPNVVAMVPGRDTALADEVVVFTTHYDHLGVGRPEAGDSIYNGAKDNASGTAALLEIADAYASLPERPRRTVMFAAVTAEESGLLGSRYLARDPPVGRFVAAINLDAVNMYGRTTDLVQLGGDHSSLGEVFAGVADHMGLTPRGDQNPEQGYFFRSDQFSFVQEGVPALYVEEGTRYVGEPDATGVEREEAYRSERYHQPDDEMLPEYTMGGAAQQSAAAFLVSWVAANADRAPRWHPDSPFAPPGARDTTPR